MRFAWKNNARQRDKDDDDISTTIYGQPSAAARTTLMAVSLESEVERTKMGIADGCLRFALAAEWCACKEKAMSTCR